MIVQPMFEPPAATDGLSVIARPSTPLEIPVAKVATSAPLPPVASGVQVALASSFVAAKVGTGFVAPCVQVFDTLPFS